jgi:hypothetical protein
VADGVTTAPIELGMALFTLVEPHRGHEVAYNRWYERDHFYAGCMIGPYNLSGRRFVATRQLKDLRYPVANPIVPDSGTGSYLALYWVLAGHTDEWNTWAVDQVNALHAAGRMFTDRDHVHTLLYDYEWAVSRDPDGVPPELALDHPYAGAVAVFVDPTDGDRATLDPWLRDELLPGVLAGSAAGQVLSFSPRLLLADAPSDVGRQAPPPGRQLQLWFLDADPSVAWEKTFAVLGDRIAESGRADVVWAAPFVPTIPGTDTYTDQLW